jgi:dTDP-4-dehydrorhamnose reductase
MTGESGMADPAKRILITGATGLVGSRLFDFLRRHTDWEIIGTSRSAGDHSDHVVDLTDNGRVNTLKELEPVDVIVHTAAISKTDECEKNKEACYAANVLSTQNLLSAFKDSKLVYFSTYAVYNVPEGNCKESAPVSPTNYYIGTKISGEALVKNSRSPVIFRPSVIFGFTPFERSGKNYFMQLIDNIRNNKITRSPVDQYFNPVHVDTVAEITCRALENNITGVYNIGSNENISKYEFNRKIMAKFSLDQKYLEGVTSQSLAVTRPNNGTISSGLVQETLHYDIPDLDQMIDNLFLSTRGHMVPGP